MRTLYGLASGLWALSVIALALVLPSASVAQEEVEVVFDFLPAQAAYHPGDNFTIEFNIRNSMLAGSGIEVKVTDLVAYFSWMAPNEDVRVNVSGESVWLEPDELQVLSMSLSIPSNATVKAYAYKVSVDYLKNYTAWPGSIFPGTWSSETLHDFFVAERAEGFDYVPFLAAAALVIALGSIGAVAYSRKGRAEKKRAPVVSPPNSLGMAQAPAAMRYPVIHAAPGEKFPIERGFIYLVKEQRPNISFAMFNEAVNHGAKGMLVVREHPNRLKQMHEFDAAKILWLTRRVGEDHIDPTELSLLSLHISKFVESTPKSVVLLEGLEYLITQNDFETVLRFVNHLHDFVLAHDCAVVIIVDPRVLATRELALLERSSRIVEPGEYSVVKPDRLSEGVET
ncbi:MAG: DUF835 domain-containing protein [Thermoplasmata archaeon]